MQKLFNVFFSSKKRAALTIVFLLLLAIFAVYFFMGINRNLKAMNAVPPAEATPYFPDYPAVQMGNRDPALVKRGEYLTKAGDCIACHTNTLEKGKPFAGGLPMVTPFGTIYSPNITPDQETGIGRWTDEQFIKAMRHGISPKGQYYFPAFPYFYFSKITTEDLLAIKAYLDSVPAVFQQNLKNKMLEPFNHRFLQMGWRLLFFKTKVDVFKPDPKKSDVWNRGAYLVEGLGHCAMCHSPSYHLLIQSISLGAPIRKYDLTGAKIQGYLAPNITRVNLATVSEEEIVKVFTEDRYIGGGKIKGPMLEVNHNSLRYLSHSDLLAIATYLKAVQSQTPPKPKGGPGKAIYESYCSGCHAMGSGGAPKYGDAASWTPILKPGIDKAYTNAIKGIGGMPSKGSCMSCTDEEIKQAVDYMAAVVTGSSAGTVPKVTKLQPLTLSDGKRIYEKNCAVCHQSGYKDAPRPGDQQAFQSSIDAGFLETYENVVTGRKGHLPQGACVDCSDGEIKAAIKYMLQQSTTTKDYSLW